MAIQAGGLLVLLAVGGAIAYAATRKKKVGEEKPAETCPEGEIWDAAEQRCAPRAPAPELETVALHVVRDQDKFGRESAGFLSDSPRFEQGQRETTAFVVGSVPVRVSVSVPKEFDPPGRAEARVGNRLVAGEPGTTRDFVFEINQYAQPQAGGTFASGAYSVFLTANYAAGGYGYSIPMYIFAVPN